MTSTGVAGRRQLFAAVPPVLAILAAAAVLLPDYLTTLRALLVVPLLVWAPGWVIAGPLLGRTPPGIGSRLVVALGISLTLSVLISVAWNWLPGGITGRSVVWSIAALTLLGTAVAWGWSRISTHDVPHPSAAARVHFSPMLAIASLASLVIVGLAVTVAALGQVNQTTPAFSELWVAKASMDSLQVGVKNDEGRPMDYRLVVLVDGQEADRRDGVQLDAAATWHTLVANPPGARRVTVELFRASDAAAYRSVTWNNAAPSPS